MKTKVLPPKNVFPPKPQTWLRTGQFVFTCKRYWCVWAV